ncbi:MAG: PH domain-containing protein [Patescibacteria group bacterium]
MKYQKFLAPHEHIICVLEYAKSEFIWDIFIGFLPAIILAFIFEMNFFAILGGLLIGSFLFIKALYIKYTLAYLITDKRIVIKKGLIGQSTLSADYTKLTDVTVEQGILGRLLLNTGTIKLNTAGSDLEEINLRWVSNPFSTKDILYSQMHKS